MLTWTPFLLRAAPAAPRKSHPRQAIQAIAPAPLDLLGRSWSFLKGLWSEEGCRIDPDGRCLTGAPQAPQPRTDTGCMIDPSGRCHT
jgi:hypothetical protein